MFLPDVEVHTVAMRTLSRSDARELPGTLLQLSPTGTGGASRLSCWIAAPGNVVAVDDRSLRSLTVNENQLNGTIPTTLGPLANLQ